MVWDSIIAGYLFLAGLGAGAFILGALSSWSGKRNGVKPAKLKLAAFIIGPVAVAVGTLLLIVDAKAGAANPLRVFLSRVQPSIGHVMGRDNPVPVSSR